MWLRMLKVILLATLGGIGRLITQSDDHEVDPFVGTVVTSVAIPKVPGVDVPQAVRVIVLPTKAL